VGKNIVTGKKVGGLIEQYNKAVLGNKEEDKGPSRPKKDRALEALTETNNMYNPALKASSKDLAKKA